jgi:hypothetical protein
MTFGEDESMQALCGTAQQMFPVQRIIYSRFRGLQVGVKYVEMLQQVRKHMQIAPLDLP